MPPLHLLFKKEGIDPTRLQGEVVMLPDVLFATATIAHVCGRGITGIWPARDAGDAQRIAANIDAPALAGEYLGQPTPGFGPAMPLALADVGGAGTTLVYAATKGTVALTDTTAAAHVYVGALLNGAAPVALLAQAHPDAQVLLVSAGSVDRFNREDFYAAAPIAAHFERSGRYSLTDAAMASQLMYRLRCRHGPGCVAGGRLIHRAGHRQTGAGRYGQQRRVPEHAQQAQPLAEMGGAAAQKSGQRMTLAFSPVAHAAFALLRSNLPIQG